MGRYPLTQLDLEALMEGYESNPADWGSSLQMEVLSLNA
jgi:hypothetical protein